LQNGDSDPLRDIMDQPEYRCFAGSRSAGKDAERMIDRHFHGSMLRRIELHPGVAPISLYRRRNDSEEVV
jgi:hypothetical protein